MAGAPGENARETGYVGNAGAAVDIGVTVMDAGELGALLSPCEHAASRIVAATKPPKTKRRIALASTAYQNHTVVGMLVEKLQAFENPRIERRVLRNFLGDV